MAQDGSSFSDAGLQALLAQLRQGQQQRMGLLQQQNYLSGSAANQAMYQTRQIAAQEEQQRLANQQAIERQAMALGWTPESGMPPGAYMAQRGVDVFGQETDLNTARQEAQQAQVLFGAVDRRFNPAGVYPDNPVHQMESQYGPLATYDYNADVRQGRATPGAAGQALAGTHPDADTSELANSERMHMSERSIPGRPYEQQNFLAEKARISGMLIEDAVTMGTWERVAQVAQDPRLEGTPDQAAAAELIRFFGGMPPAYAKEVMGANPSSIDPRDGADILMERNANLSGEQAPPRQSRIPDPTAGPAGLNEGMVLSDLQAISNYASTIYERMNVYGDDPTQIVADMPAADRQFVVDNWRLIRSEMERRDQRPPGAPETPEMPQGPTSGRPAPPESLDQFLKDISSTIGKSGMDFVRLPQRIANSLYRGNNGNQ